MKVELKDEMIELRIDSGEKNIEKLLATEEVIAEVPDEEIKEMNGKDGEGSKNPKLDLEEEKRILE